MSSEADDSSEFYLFKFRSWTPPLVVQVMIYPFVLVGFVVLVILSIPWVFFASKWVDFKERKLTEQLAMRGRAIELSDALSRVRENQGTLIGEQLSITGPYRLWWTEEDIPSLSPYECCHAEEFVWEAFLNGASSKGEFFEWCAERYTNPHSGKGLIVPISRPEEYEQHSQEFSELRRMKRMVEIVGGFRRDARRA